MCRWELVAVLSVMGPLAAACGDDRPHAGGRPAVASSDVLFTSAADADPAELEAAARAFLEAELDPDVFGAVDDDVLVSVFVDDLDLAHVRFQQTVGGVPVLGSEVVVHLRASGEVRALTNDLLRTVRVDPIPAVTADEALAVADPPTPLAPTDQGADGVLSQEPVVELWVVRHEGVDHLAWSVRLLDLDPVAPSAPRVFVDAHAGEEFWRYDDLQTVPATTQTQYDGNRGIQATTYTGPNRNYLEDGGRNFQTLDFNGTTGSLFEVWVAVGAVFPNRALGSVHYGTQSVIDYYLSAHGRNGIDGLGGPATFTGHGGIIPRVTGAGRFGSNYNNAFWDRTNRIFVSGNGDGFNFGPLVSVDVIGHEFSHGVTQFTSNLIYANESGALNESFSDVMAAAVEAYVDGAVSGATWEIGEDCYTPLTAGDALRYFDDPTADGSSSDHYDDRYVGAQDNGGVHWNSGIGNLAFYLVSEGGDHPFYGGTPVTGIGIEDAADIWYRAQTTYVTSSTDFHGMRIATLLAAADLYGDESPEVTTVDEAWSLVGVDPWVLLPSGYAASGVGAPSAVVRAGGDVVLAFETMTGPPSELCPNGVWGIGLATSTSGLDFAYVGAAPVLTRSAGTYRGCVVAHPTLMSDDLGTGLHLWFKAEQESTTCGDSVDCLYTGVGYAHIQSNLTTVDTISASPVVVTGEVMGYPSVVRSAGTYYMALQRDPSVWLATAPAATGPWTVAAAPVMDPGLTTYATDEVYSPALICEGDVSVPASALTAWFGGRDRGGAWGPVVDGGVGRATSTNGLAWTVSPGTLFQFEGDTRWRHWSALRHGTGVILYYSATVNGANRIGLQTDLTAWTPAGVSTRTCPQPAWW